MQRFVWVDNAKAILIFLVVLGHFHYVYAPVAGKNLIYAFHVPAFLVITGFLLPAGFGRLPALTVLRRWIFLYLRAYAFFSLIAIGIWWAAASAGAGRPADPWPAIAGTLYGVAGETNGLVHQDLPLWYFPFLTASLAGAWIAAALSDRVSPLIGWGVALAWAGFGALYHGPRLPWDLDIAGMGVVMVLAGQELRRHIAAVEAWVAPAHRAWLLAGLCAAALAGLSGLNGLTNLNGANFGASGLLFLAAALAGTAMVLLLASRIPPSRLARTLSTETLTIFALHIYLVYAVSKLPHPASWAGQQAAMLALAALVLLLCLPVARVLQPVLARLVLLQDGSRRDASRPRHGARPQRPVLSGR